MNETDEKERARDERERERETARMNQNRVPLAMTDCLTAWI